MNLLINNLKETTELLAEYISQLEGKGHGNVHDLIKNKNRILSIVPDTTIEKVLPQSKVMLSKGQYQPCIMIDRYIPEWNNHYLRFRIDSPAAYMPIIMCSEYLNPLWWGTTNVESYGGNTIYTSAEATFSWQMRISGNFWTHYHNLVQNTTRRWLNFAQFKQSYSYDHKLVLAISWDWSRKYPAYMIQLRGSDKPTPSDDVDYPISRDIPMILGEWQKFVVTVAFDPTGVKSFTKVIINDTTWLETKRVNCFPVTNPELLETEHLSKVAVRGMYFGGYCSRSPAITMHSPITVDYRNMCVDISI